jgi:hypothetical protein
MVDKMPYIEEDPVADWMRRGLFTLIVVVLAVGFWILYT